MPGRRAGGSLTSFFGSSTRVASEAGAAGAGGGGGGGGETLGPSSSGSAFLEEDLVDLAEEDFFDGAAGEAMVTGLAWKSCAA